MEGQGLSRAEVSIMEGGEDAKEWASEGRVWAEGPLELSSLQQTLPFPGAWATGIGGPSWS